MRSALLLIVPAALALSACGSSEKDAGAKACTIYQEALADSPETITDMFALDAIKDMLSDLDDPTRRAFSALITAADANPYSASTDPNAIDEKASEVRSVCLSEHSVEIAN